MFAYDNSIFSTHYDVIFSIIKSTNCQKYLELGIYDASLISRVAEIVPIADGVDMSDLRTKFNFNFINKSTDEFFNANNQIYDIIFIDADHCFESVVKDLENSLKILNKNGIIFIHDTDPMYQYLTQPCYCNDSYKMCNYIKENHPELSFVNLPVSEAGLMIIKRNNEYRHLNY